MRNYENSGDGTFLPTSPIEADGIEAVMFRPDDPDSADAGDPDAEGTLRVVMRDGTAYDYADVTADEADALAEADDPDAHLEDRIAEEHMYEAADDPDSWD